MLYFQSMISDNCMWRPGTDLIKCKSDSFDEAFEELGERILSGELYTSLCCAWIIVDEYGRQVTKKLEVLWIM